MRAPLRRAALLFVLAALAARSAAIEVGREWATLGDDSDGPTAEDLGVPVSGASSGDVEPYDEPVLKQPKGDCASFSSCGECIVQPHCGWCDYSQTCVPGTPEAARNDTGPCPVYQYGLCRSEPCKHYPTCEACLADPLCGWCSSTGVCAEGKPQGPLNMHRICPGAWCHSPRYTARRNEYIHHALDPEINVVCDRGCKPAPGMSTGATGEAGPFYPEEEPEAFTMSMPDAPTGLSGAQAVGAATLHEAVEDAMKEATSKVPAQDRKVVAEAVEEALQRVSLSPEDAKAVQDKARADLIEFERERLAAIREIKAKVTAEQDKVERMFRQQEGDWPKAVEEASTVMLNLIKSNHTLLGGDPESAQWAEGIEKYIANLQARVQHAFGASTGPAARAAEASVEQDYERQHAADEGILQDEGKATRFRAVTARLMSKTAVTAGRASRAARARAINDPLEGLTPEERRVIASLFPDLGQSKGRVSALTAKLAARRVIDGRRAAFRAERDAEAFMDEARAAKTAALESAKEEVAAADKLKSPDIRRMAMERLANAELNYREAVMGVESAVAKVKAMLESESAQLLKNGANVVDVMAEGDVAKIDMAKAAEDASARKEEQQRLEEKMEKQKEREQREDEEIAKLQEHTDALAAEATLEEDAKAAHKRNEAEEEKRLREAVDGASEAIKEKEAEMQVQAQAGALEETARLQREVDEHKAELEKARARLDAFLGKEAKEAEQEAKKHDEDVEAKAEQTLEREEQEEEKYEEQRDKMRAQAAGAHA